MKSGYVLLIVLLLPVFAFAQQPAQDNQTKVVQEEPAQTEPAQTEPAQPTEEEEPGFELNPLELGSWALIGTGVLSMVGGMGLFMYYNNQVQGLARKHGGIQTVEYFAEKDELVGLYAGSAGAFIGGIVLAGVGLVLKAVSEE